MRSQSHIPTLNAAISPPNIPFLAAQQARKSVAFGVEYYGHDIGVIKRGRGLLVVPPQRVGMERRSQQLDVI